MKILHILDERWDSGLTAYGLAAARAMKQRGHEVILAVRPGMWAAQQAEVLGLATHSLTTPLSLRRWMARQGFDVVNAHTGAGHSLGFLSHGSVQSRWFEPGEARKLSIRPGQGFLFRETDSVIVASKALADSYGARFPFLMDQISVIYPGIEIPPLRPIPPAPLRVGLLGRLDPVKGHVFFLEAVKHMKDQLKDELFLIAGEEKNLAREQLEQQVAQWGISPWIKFLGRVPDAGVFMEECHVGVIASVESEAVSRAALEWLARGRPLVATEVGALPEMVLNGDNGFWFPRETQPGWLAQYASSWMTRIAEKMGERARRTAETRFGFDRLGEETERAYTAALDRRKRRFA